MQNILMLRSVRVFATDVRPEFVLHKGRCYEVPDSLARKLMERNPPRDEMEQLPDTTEYN